MNSALALGNARARNPIDCHRGPLGTGAGAAPFRDPTHRANASGQRAVTGDKITYLEGGP
jgi:hypothetical protein